MNFTLKIWRQKDAKAKGAFETYKVENISADTSFLEMLDILNNNLIHEGKEPVAFDHDCREGICGMCSLHTTAVRTPGRRRHDLPDLHAPFQRRGDDRHRAWRSAAFPVIKDLVVDRSAYDKILQAGGFISVRTNAVQDANNIPIPRPMPTLRWMPLPASVAVPALRPVRTARRCFSSPPVCRRSRNCRRDVSRVPAAPSDGGQDGRTGLR